MSLCLSVSLSLVLPQKARDREGRMGGLKDHQDYAVKVKGCERVKAVVPSQEYRLPHSNLDLLMPAIDVGVFFCYEKQELMSFQTMVSHLKASLAQALVTYYAFGGEVVTNSVGEPELLCNNHGVDFIHAYADVELRDLVLHNPDQSVEGKLVPKKKGGVLCVQVTELKCGGMVVACSFDHRTADAYSANMFFVSWAEIARSKPISLPPSFRRSLLNPRRLAYYEAASMDRLYVPISSLPASFPPADLRTTVNRTYYIVAADIERMQAEANSGIDGRERRSKLQSFSAYLWRVMSRYAKREGKESCRMGIVVDGRSRMSSPVMPSYFGNVLSWPYGDLRVEEMEAMEMGEVASAVHDLLRPAVREEHFLELIEWIEARRPEGAVTRVYAEGGQEDKVSALVSSGLRFPIREVEFGWGRPVFGSYHFSPGTLICGYVMPMPSVKGGSGDWVVYMHFPKGLVDTLEAEAGDVFRPFTSDYLPLSTNPDS